MKINFPDEESFFTILKNWLLGFLIRFKKPNEALYLILKKIHLGREIEEKQLKLLANSFRYLQCKADNLILKEGEIGDHFYFILKGSVRIFTHSLESKREITLARLESGDFFGEQALLEEMPGYRTSSARASTDCEFLTLSHADYLKVLNPRLKKLLKHIGNKQLFDSFCQNKEVLGLVKKKVLKELSGKIFTFSDGEIIFKAQEDANSAYFILSGNVEIEFKDKKGTRTTRLGKGALFGELGVLNKTKRAGTAIARGPLKVVAYERNVFKKLCDSSPELKNYIASLAHVYQIGHNGSVSIYYGKFLTINAVTAIYQLEDGSTVNATRAIGNLAFSMTRSSVEDPKILHYAYGVDIRRKLGVIGNTIVSVVSFGEWAELHEICGLILSAKPVTEAQLELFSASGMLGIGKLKVISGEEKKETLCNCLNISKGKVYDAFQAGASNIDAIIERTGAGSVCGTCRPKIVELFGLKAWTTAKLHKKISLHPDVCSFQFTLVEPEKFNYKPGQYVVISILIHGVFINRSYTLTSVPKRDAFIELTIKREKNGYFSSWLFDRVDENTLVRISEPVGSFTLETENKHPIVCFVGGIGVTPAIAFARYLSMNSDRTIYIDYSARTRDDFILMNEWNELTKKNQNITIKFRVTQEDGRIKPDAVKKVTEDFPNAQFYICGPGSFENFLVECLKGNKIIPSKIKTERFIQAGNPGNETIKM